MAEKEIIFKVEDGIGILTINRPEKMNSITDDMLIEIENLINEITLDDKVRALIITGTGRAFCAGTDLDTGLARDQAEAGRKRAEKINKLDLPENSLPRWPFTQLPKPTIAAVNGAAVGMGAEWTAQCDIRIASTKARFGWVGSMRGITPDTGAGPYLLPHIVGLSKALELMYSGEIINAEEALKIGLVSMVVPQEKLLDEAIKMAIKISRAAPLALKGIKSLTYGALERDYDSHFIENGIRLNETTLSEDSKEGVKSFFEKREPVWKGR